MNIRIAAAVLVSTVLARAASAVETWDVLAVHKTTAEFEGLRAHRCMGLTSLCPDRCGHSGQLASFKITAYTAYEKKGEYGDEKQTTFQFLTVDNATKTKIPADLLAKINALKPGDKVTLEWEHRYMNRDGSRWPERPVTKLEKLR